MEEKKQVKSEYGTMNSTVWNFDGIRMGHALSRFNTLTSFPSSGHKDVVRLHFGLRGNYSFTYQQLGKTFNLIGGHHNMMYSESFDMVVQTKTLELETFGVQFPRNVFIQFTEQADDLLKRFADNILSGKPAILSEHWGALDLPIQNVIEQVLNCRYTGDIKRLFLLSKSIELLALSAESCSRSQGRKEIFIKNSIDKEKIVAVKDLINARLHCPPSLPEIARLAGLNEYKLKRGFREIFNTTVFGYLTEQRLQLAHRYLLDTDKTAAEISLELGYSTPQHFNNAFRKKFGMTPDSVRKNPRSAM